MSDFDVAALVAALSVAGILVWALIWEDKP
jgi:hypothetical protein